MFNRSGKAKKFYRRGTGLFAGIRYHPDDAAEAAAFTAKRFTPGTLICAIHQGKGRYDLYALTNEGPNDSAALTYCSKHAAAVLAPDYTVWDGAARNGIDVGYGGPYDLVRRFAEAVHGDPEAFRCQEIPD